MGNSFTLIFLVIFLSVPGQQDPEKIFWEEGILSWEEFRAEPDKRSTFQANTSAGISYSWGIRNENGRLTLKYEVQSYFNPDGSWVVPESRGSGYLLKHEQLHFDITELHARKLRKNLSKIKVEDLGKDPGKTLNEMYEVMEQEKSLMQLKYDKETNHSIDREAQARWQEYVKREIKKYGNFKA